MFKNYITIALRALSKNKLFAAINVFGLAIGLTIFLFGNIIANYEKSHDTMWQDYERIYYIASQLSPQADIGVNRMETTYDVLGPLFKEGIPEVEYMARTLSDDYLVSIGDTHFNEMIQFADPALLKIFSFNFIHGDADALEDPKGVVLTESQAIKYFGRTDVRGEVIVLDHEHEFRIQAVIEDLPSNSHFISTQLIMGDPFNIILSTEALRAMAQWEAGYRNTSSGHYTYLKLSEPMPLAQLTNKVNTIFLAHAPAELIETFMTGVYARPITAANTGLWDMINLPVVESIQVLGLLVLIIAVVNYTNLATAQSLGRTREVGMRKALGASRSQLMMQFLTESITITAIGMLLAMVLIEIMLPVFNESTGKSVSLDYLNLIPYLIGATIVVGIVAGAYPSYLITKTNAIYALKGMSIKGSKGNLVRSMMIGIQFVLSIFMLGMVMVVFFQNAMVRDSSNIYPKEDIIVLNRTDKDEVHERKNILRDELTKIPNVEHVTFSTHIPFDQSNSTNYISRVSGDGDSALHVNRLWTDDQFIHVFGIELLAGRNFSREVSSDIQRQDSESAAIIINELLRQQLGFKSNEEAINQSVYSLPGEDGTTFRFEIIGVVETQNIHGLHSSIKPFMFRWSIGAYKYGAIKLAPGTSGSIIEQIEDTWRDVLPEQPIEHEYLIDVFNRIFTIFKTMNSVLAGFAAVAMTLASIGLFGLAAYMAKVRTKEIGIRKVLGANVVQLVKMMLWQFSKPVMWAIIIALPLVYLASGMYLNFFANRIEMTLQVPLIIIGGVAAVFISWCVIALHALKVAKSSPVHALHYE